MENYIHPKIRDYQPIHPRNTYTIRCQLGVKNPSVSTRTCWIPSVESRLLEVPGYMVMARPLVVRSLQNPLYFKAKLERSGFKQVLFHKVNQRTNQKIGQVHCGGPGNQWMLTVKPIQRGMLCVSAQFLYGVNMVLTHQNSQRGSFLHYSSVGGGTGGCVWLTGVEPLRRDHWFSIRMAYLLLELGTFSLSLICESVGFSATHTQ